MSSSVNLNSPFRINKKIINDNTNIKAKPTSIPDCPNKTKTAPFISFKKVGSPQKKATLTKIQKHKKVVQLQSKFVSKKSGIGLRRKKELKVCQSNKISSYFPSDMTYTEEPPD